MEWGNEYATNTWRKIQKDHALKLWPRLYRRVAPVNEKKNAWIYIKRRKDCRSEITGYKWTKIHLKYIDKDLHMSVSRIRNISSMNENWLKDRRLVNTITPLTAEGQMAACLRDRCEWVANTCRTHSPVGLMTGCGPYLVDWEVVRTVMIAVVSCFNVHSSFVCCCLVGNLLE